MISFFSDGCLRDIVAKIQKVEDRTKKLVSFFVETTYLRQLYIGKVTKSRGQNKETRFFFVETTYLRQLYIGKVTKKREFQLDASI